MKLIRMILLKFAPGMVFICAGMAIFSIVALGEAVRSYFSGSGAWIYVLDDHPFGKFTCLFAALIFVCMLILLIFADFRDVKDLWDPTWLKWIAYSFAALAVVALSMQAYLSIHFSGGRRTIYWPALGAVPYVYVRALRYFYLVWKNPAALLTRSNR